MKQHWNKILAMMLSVLMVFAVAGCGGGETASGGDDADASGGVLVGFDDDVSGVQGTASGDTGSGSTGGNGGGNGGTTNNGGGNGGGNTGPNANHNVDANMQGSDPFANVPSNLKGTKVVFAQWGDEGASEYQKVITAFTKKTGIKVQLSTITQANYVTTLVSQIAARSGPDAIITYAYPTGLDTAQPLQNIIDLSDDFWDKELVDRLTIGGNTYAVNSLKGPWQDFEMTYFNKKLFEDNGITSPRDYFKKGQWTYENFVKCLQEVAALGDDYVGGMMDPNILAAQMGTPLFSYDAKSATFSQNLMAMADAFKLSCQCYAKGYWKSFAYWGTMSTGKVGIYPIWLYGAKYNGYFSEMDNSTLDAVPMPTSWNGKKLKQVDGGRSYGIAKGAKNPTGAAYFLRYYLDYSYYEPAGCKCFKNNAVRDAYFNETIPLAQKDGRVYYNSTPLSLVTDDSQLGFLENDVTRAGEDQVTVNLSKKQNTVNEAVKRVNERLAQYKK